MSNSIIEEYRRGAIRPPEVVYIEAPKKEIKQRKQCPFCGGLSCECKGDVCALWADKEEQCTLNYGMEAVSGRYCPFSHAPGYSCGEECVFKSKGICTLLNNKSNREPIEGRED